MKIRPVGIELFDTDGQTDKRTDIHNEANSGVFSILRTCP
jgi:hypothetical protein